VKKGEKTQTVPSQRGSERRKNLNNRSRKKEGGKREKTRELATGCPVKKETHPQKEGEFMKKEEKGGEKCLGREEKRSYTDPNDRAVGPLGTYERQGTVFIQEKVTS